MYLPVLQPCFASVPLVESIAYSDTRLRYPVLSYPVMQAVQNAVRLPDTGAPPPATGPGSSAGSGGSGSSGGGGGNTTVIAVAVVVAVALIVLGAVLIAFLSRRRSRRKSRSGSSSSDSSKASRAARHAHVAGGTAMPPPPPSPPPTSPPPPPPWAPQMHAAPLWHAQSFGGSSEGSNVGSHSAFQGAPRGAHSPEFGYAAGQMRPQYSGSSGAGGGSAASPSRRHFTAPSRTPLRACSSALLRPAARGRAACHRNQATLCTTHQSCTWPAPARCRGTAAAGVGAAVAGSGSVQHHHGQKSLGARQKGVSPHLRGGTTESALFTDMSTMSSRTVATDVMNQLEGSRVALEFALDKLAAQRPPGVLVGRCCNPRTRLLGTLRLHLTVW